MREVESKGRVVQPGAVGEHVISFGIKVEHVGGKRPVQSCPLRVNSRTPAASRRTSIRKPSCLISCSHPAPAGGFLAGRAGRAHRSRGTLRDATTWAVDSSGPGRVESDLSVKTKTHFAFRVDIWDDTGDSIVEHVAGVDDFEVAEATYRAAVARWPSARITLRQGIRVMHDTG
jgi:hypothetical protein